MNRIFARVASVALCIFASLGCINSFAPVLVGQVATGTIVGVVEDDSGAVIPGAVVEVVHVATQDSRQAVTNERGEFNIPFLRIGEHTISAEVEGFRRKILTGIVLRVDQTLRLRISLELGAVVENVEISAAAPLIDTETSSLGQVIDNQKIVNLPLNGRNPFMLGLLSGNTVPVKGMGSNLPFAAGGGRFASNDVLLDGVDNNTSTESGSIGRSGIAYMPSVDAVEEFKVKTNNFSAEFGRSAGAVISATIKSGGNDVHGSLWEFLRNEQLDANNFFSNANRIERQPFKQNQFGGAISGPVTIPGVYAGKNRTFFFFDYEATTRRTSASSSTQNIPPEDFRRGDFSRYDQPIFDPRARRIGPGGTVVSTQFPNNLIPEDQLNPSSEAIVGLIPGPNAGSPGDQARNYIRIVPRPYDNKQFDIKLDQRVGNANNLYGRFSLANGKTPNPGSFDGFIGGGSDDIRNVRSAVFNDIHIIGPSTVNEFRFGYTRHNGSSIGVAPEGVDFALQNDIALFPFPVQGFPAIAFNFSGLPNSSSQFSSWGGGNSDLSIENTFHVADNLSINRGNHAIKVGGEVRRYRFDAIRGGGEMIFGSIFSSSTDAPGSGAPFADFLMGYLSATQGTQQLDWSRQRDTFFGLYVQDDWRITPQFTMNYGIRYDLYTQPVDDRDRGGLFDVSTLMMALPGQDGYSRAIVRGDHNNFAPRLGFAWSTNRLTVRTGGGVFFTRRDQNQQVTQFAANIPNIPVVLFPSIIASETVTPPVTINSRLQVGSLDPTLASYTPENPLGGGLRTADFEHSEAPYAYQWNFSLQYQLLDNMVVEASYSGLKGNRLVNRRDLNQIRFQDALAGHTTQADRPIPFVTGNVSMDSANASNIYNALNLRVEKRMSSGLNFLANYTWSKNLESQGSGSSSFSQNGGTTYPLDSHDLGRERSYAPLDVPHAFVLSGGYEFPFGQGKRWVDRTGFLDYLIGGWKINSILSLQSGFPSDVRSTRAPNAGQLFARFNVPDRVSGESMYLPNGGVEGYLNPAAFTEPERASNVNGVPITRFGNAARRVVRGPGSTNVDLSLFKVFMLSEAVRLQFRAEAFNLTNTPTFFLPSATNQALTIGNPNFGKLTSSSATGRQLQFGLKLVF